MSDWKLHTPAGVNDILPAECSAKKDLEGIIWTVLSAAGYKEVETPAFEYYDCYIGTNGQITQERMFKFFDEQGRILVLRPDFTTSIARMAATKTADGILPQRYMYSGNIFRADPSDGVKRRETTQMGIELIGSSSPAADAEVISCAIESMLAVGIEELSMEIGQVAFFNGLVEQAGLDDELTEKLRERIDSKDSLGIRLIVENLDIDNNIKELMIGLPYLFGDLSVLDKAYVPGLNELSTLALDNIKRIYELLCLYGFEKYISIDLGMLQSIDYYTGTIFKCYTHGVGFPICAGGRYDNLMGKFGSPKGAVGVALNINRIMSALGKTEGSEVSASVVYAHKNAEGLAYELSYNLRVNGCLVEMYIGEGSRHEASVYSKNIGAACMLEVFPDGKLLIDDYEAEDVIRTTVNEFLGYNEEAAVPSAQEQGFRMI